MPDIEHSTITDPNIHEPKDIAAASSGQVYVADGLGSGTWTNQTSNSFTLTNVLTASDTTTQTLTTLNTPEQISFGTAQFSGSDPVSLTAAGNININQTGTYSIKVSLFADIPAATSDVYVRFLLNAVETDVVHNFEVTEKTYHSLELLNNFNATDIVSVEWVTTNDIAVILSSNSSGVAGWTANPSASVVVNRLA